MIAILVPVLRRAHLIGPLFENISVATSDTDHRVVFICSPHDGKATKACQATGAETVVVPWRAGKSDFAKKINLVYEQTDDEWLFQGATDLVFHYGWAGRALRLGKQRKVGVVGTNDMGNPQVKRGHHSTHTLFSRAYIEEYGGTFDGTGKVFSEVYDHQFVDTEFIQMAIMREQFAPSTRSVVEHLHPHWGKGTMDPTYAKAVKDFEADAALYNRRMREAKILMGVPVSGNRPRSRPGVRRR